MGICFFEDLALLWITPEPEPNSGFVSGAGRDAAAEGAELFDEKNEPLSPGPGCSQRGIAYSADARITMTPRATKMLSMGVLTLPVCVLPRDIFAPWSRTNSCQRRPWLSRMITDAKTRGNAQEALTI